MANQTNNTGAFIDDEVYSSFIYTNLHAAVMPEMFYRNVSDFGHGTTLNIKAVGSRSIQDAAENSPIAYSPIDTNTITMTISEYVGDAFYITDMLREDGTDIPALISASGMETARAIEEDFETKFYLAAYNAQTAADPNTINGVAHRLLAQNANEVMSDLDFADMGLAFDMANAPLGGRVAIVPPVVAASYNKQVTLTAGLDRTPMFEEVYHSGFRKEHRFMGHIFGWDVYVSNRLPYVPAGTDIDGTNSVTNEGRAAIFMCVADDNCKPILAAWRRQPTSYTEYNKDLRRTETVTSARYGFGVARLDTLGVVVVDATATTLA